MDSDLGIIDRIDRIVHKTLYDFCPELWRWPKLKAVKTSINDEVLYRVIEETIKDFVHSCRDEQEIEAMRYYAEMYLEDLKNEVK